MVAHYTATTGGEARNMFGSNVLEVGIGMVFTFLTVSLVCGQITEALATIMKWRATTLLKGVKSLVNDEKFTGLALTLYNSAQVHPRGDGQATTQAEIEKNPPSYIDPKQFAQAMLNAVAKGETTLDGIKAAVSNADNVPNDQIRNMLTSLTTHADDSVEKLRDHIAAWFDSGMQRVSGDYKRRTQVWCFFLGLAIAAILNIDTLHLAGVLWSNPNIAHAVTAVSHQTMDEALIDIEKLGLPIGWGQGQPEIWTNFCLDWNHVIPAVSKLIGWTITAASTLFGTSFWYDALGDVLKLRGTGPAPAPTTPTAA
jgi:hypothetical protein